MTRVLMVDDEEDLVWSTGRQMARERPEIAFQGLTDPRAALKRIREQAPDLLVTDVRMPGMTGIELMLAAREVDPRLPVIVVTAYGSPEVRSEVGRTRSVAYLEKPFAFRSLLGAMDGLLAGGTGFSGAISLPMLPDLIQMYALSQASGALRIVQGNESGEIWFEHGQMIHAACSGLEGAQAVYTILTWQGGRFEMRADAVPPERTIDLPWQELLVEGCRLMDEGRTSASSAVEPAQARGARPGRLSAIRESLAPRAAALAADALAVAVALDGGGVAVLKGPESAAGEPWAEAMEALIDDVRPLLGEPVEGVVECVGPQGGLAVSWGGSGIASVYAENFAAPTRASRFRSNVARWLEWSRAAQDS